MPNSGYSPEQLARATAVKDSTAALNAMSEHLLVTSVRQLGQGEHPAPGSLPGVVRTVWDGNRAPSESCTANTEPAVLTVAQWIVGGDEQEDEQ